MTPLSVLGEDEKLFQDEIEKFAREVIGPKVLEMDEKELMERDIIDSLFEMGLIELKYRSSLVAPVVTFSCLS